MEVETKNASLDTLSVTIRTLHVSGKQMTLAVFRQLPMTRVYHDDGSLLPMEYWGLVMYSIKDEGDEWIVCASGGKLYRANLEWKGYSVLQAERELLEAQSLVAWWHVCKDIGSEYPWKFPRCPQYGERWKEDALPEYEEEVVFCANYLEVCMRAKTTRLSLAGLTQLFIAV